MFINIVKEESRSCFSGLFPVAFWELSQLHELFKGESRVDDC